MVTGEMPKKHSCLSKAPCFPTILTDHFARRAAAVDELLAGAMGGGEAAADKGVQHPVAPVGHQGTVPWELQFPPGWAGMHGEPLVREPGLCCTISPKQRSMLTDDHLFNPQWMALSPPNTHQDSSAGCEDTGIL